MPISLQKLRSETRDLSIPVGEDRLSFTYRPAAFTPEVEDLFEATGEQGARTLPFREAVASVVSGWDLTQEDGGPALPVCTETLKHVPSRVLVDMVVAISEDHSPKKA